MLCRMMHRSLWSGLLRLLAKLAALLQLHLLHLHLHLHQVLVRAHPYHRRARCLVVMRMVVMMVVVLIGERLHVYLYTVCWIVSLLVASQASEAYCWWRTCCVWRLVTHYERAFSRY